MNKKTTNPIPKNKTVSEEDFLKTLDIITKKLVYKFKFGYHDIDDMKQQAAIFAIEGLEKYDHSRPLENFLWTHVRNRLFNYKRDHYQRPDKPCLTCIFYDPDRRQSINQCSKFTDKSNCPEYTAWDVRNSNKRNIMKPVGIEDLSGQQVSIPDSNNSILDIVANEQIIKILDENIPASFRPTYLKLKYGDKVYKTDLVKLIECIKDILKEYNYDF